MDNREQDPPRCRELRRIGRTIRDELSRVQSSIGATERERENVSNQLRRLYDKRHELEEQLAAAIAASGLSRGRSTAVQAATNGGRIAEIDISVRLAAIKAEISSREDKLRLIEQRLESQRGDHKYWANRLGDNAREMNDLSCVL